MLGLFHSALVHVPIGLLLGYSLIECGLLFFPKWRERVSLGKYLVLLIGVMGGEMALLTGQAREELYGVSRLTDLHSTLAYITIWLYLFLFLVFTFNYLKESDKLMAKISKNNLALTVWRGAGEVAKVVSKPAVLFCLALLGLILLTVVGALGGALAHGPNADPMVSFIYSLFF